jgi:cytochrome c peroxidase
MRLRRAVLTIALAAFCVGCDRPPEWSADQLQVLRSLWIDTLPALAPDASNRVADDPAAARLGHRLFFDERLSANGKVSCATCHRPEWAFTDGFRRGEGIGTADRNTMTIIGSAYSPWFFWDGRRDSQWAQALGPLENPVEQGATRMQVYRLVADTPAYRALYARLFGPLPDITAEMPPDARREALAGVFANVGKAIAAYERRLLPGPSRFDRYVAAVLAGKREEASRHLTEDEVAGLRLFIGRPECLHCHNGPLFTNFEFHDTGAPDPTGTWRDSGRSGGVAQVLADEFNCYSAHSDAAHSDAARGDCAELNFIKADDPRFRRGFKTPTLRNVSLTAPYMHNGSFGHLSQVLDHYNRAPQQPVGRSELVPLGLTEQQLRQLEAFLRALDSPVADPRWLKPPDPGPAGR